jgi:hypothetical protein
VRAHGTSGGSSAADTVENGDQFVAAVRDDQVLLHKTVGDATFPYSSSDLNGKAILIHPVAGKTETGIYARVTSATDQDEDILLGTQPLTVGEMESIDESEIVRIYLNRDLPVVDALSARGFKLDLLPTAVTAGSGGLRVQSWGGLLSGEGVSFSGSESIDANRSVSANLSVTRDNTNFSFTPEALANWQRGRGLELGFRASMAFDADFSIEGDVTASGSLFETPKLKSPRLIVCVFIGIVPVPITLGLNGSISCGVDATTSLKGKVGVHVSASVGGSSFINPSTDTAPSDWVTTGEWPYGASGSFNVDTSNFQLTGTVDVSCSVPRIELETLVAGLAGPYLAVAPVFTLATDGTNLTPSTSVMLNAGLRASAFGLADASAEVNLLTWSPNSGQ